MAIILSIKPEGLFEQKKQENLMKKNFNIKESIIVFSLIFLLLSWFILPDWSLNIVCLACCNGLVV